LPFFPELLLDDALLLSGLGDGSRFGGDVPDAADPDTLSRSMSRLRLRIFFPSPEEEGLTPPLPVVVGACRLSRRLLRELDAERERRAYIRLQMN
jgi:hypothetical protein